MCDLGHRSKNDRDLWYSKEGQITIFKKKKTIIIIKKLSDLIRSDTFLVKETRLSTYMAIKSENKIGCRPFSGACSS